MQGARSCLLMAVEKWQGEPTWGHEPNQGQAHFCAHSGAAAFQCLCRRAQPRRRTQPTGMHGPLNKQASGMLTSMRHQHAHASAGPKLRVSQNGAEDGKADREKIGGECSSGDGYSWSRKTNRPQLSWTREKEKYLSAATVWPPGNRWTVASALTHLLMVSFRHSSSRTCS